MVSRLRERSQWIRGSADAVDAAQVLRQPLLPAAQVLGLSQGPERQQQHDLGQREIQGMATLATQARLSPAAVAGMTAELLEMGAVSVAELSHADWRSLRSWASLRPFEQRRLLQSSTDA